MAKPCPGTSGGCGTRVGPVLVSSRRLSKEFWTPTLRAVVSGPLSLTGLVSSFDVPPLASWEVQGLWIPVWGLVALLLGKFCSMPTLLMTRAEMTRESWLGCCSKTLLPTGFCWMIAGWTLAGNSATISMACCWDCTVWRVIISKLLSWSSSSILLTIVEYGGGSIRWV